MTSFVSISELHRMLMIISLSVMWNPWQPFQPLTTERLVVPRSSTSWHFPFVLVNLWMFYELLNVERLLLQSRGRPWINACIRNIKKNEHLWSFFPFNVKEKKSKLSWRFPSKLQHCHGQFCLQILVCFPRTKEEFGDHAINQRVCHFFLLTFLGSLSLCFSGYCSKEIGHFFY